MPVPFHAVRTRFLGNVASPVMSASALDTLKGLWGGELPSAAAGFGGSSDSPLEGDGFEPSVPQQIRSLFETASPVSHYGLISRPGTDGSNPPPSSAESAANFVFAREAWKGPRRRQGTIPTVSTSSGTDGSNPARSSGESVSRGDAALDENGQPKAFGSSLPAMSHAIRH